MCVEINAKCMQVWLTNVCCVHFVARLAAIAAKAWRYKQEQQPPVSEANDDGNDDVPSSKQVVFRNYAPQDVALDHEDVDYEEPNSKRTKVNVKSAFDAALEETVLETSDTATSLAPKKVNWDVKRDIQEKMDKLERKTDRSKGSAFQGETGTGSQTRSRRRCSGFGLKWMNGFRDWFGIFMGGRANYKIEMDTPLNSVNDF